MTALTIPYYDLYGEPDKSLASEFVHLESVVSRSQALSWKIQPHRHTRLMQLLWVFDGSFNLQLDEAHYSLQGSWLMVIPAGVVHGFEFQPDTNGFVLSLHEAVFVELQEDGNTSLEAVWAASLIELHEPQVVEKFTTLFSLLEHELSFDGRDAHYATIQLLKLIFITAGRQQKLASLHSSESQRETRILLRFRELIEEHYRQHLTATQYAEMLFISISTLNRLCKLHLKCSPKQMVNQRLISEAKRRLVYTKQTIDDIAITLGYKDVGYFCRQFKREAGCTAGDFRQQNRL